VPSTRYSVSVEWFVDATGRCVPISRTRALMVDIAASVEDLADAIDDVEVIVNESRALVKDSRRWRRIRESGLRLVNAAEQTIRPAG
jgi:hypothetical protein